MKTCPGVSLAGYARAVAYCESLLRPVTGQVDKNALRVHFQRMGCFLRHMGQPQEHFRSVHIAGTSGKGSTTTMIGAILRAAGMHTGVHCTPYLQTPIERMQVDDLYASPADFVHLVDALRPHIDYMRQESAYHDISYREVGVAQAFLHFARSAVDIAAIETGMGGRYDYTNYIQPLAAAIVTVDYDHVGILGPTLAEIAYHKAGIIKDGVPTVTGVAPGPALRVIEEEAAQRRAPLFRLGQEIRYTIHSVGPEGSVFDYTSEQGTINDVQVKLLGRHQVANAALAIALAEQLRAFGLPISNEAIRRGLAQARVPGRLEIVQRQPTVILDGAHNPEKMRSLAAALRELFADRVPVLVVGVLAAKQVDSILAEVVPLARKVVVTSPTVLDKPAVAPDALADACRQFGVDVVVERDVSDAVRRAEHMAGTNGLVCVTGSLYMVGQARELWVPTSAILNQRTSFPQ